jgi:hypothetical protein
MGRAVRVDLDYGGEQVHAVVKRLPAKTVVSSAAELARISEYLRSSSPRLAQTLMGFVGWDDAHGWVIMEYVRGPSLLDLLQRHLFFPRRDDAPIRKALGRVAQTLAVIGRRRGAEVGLHAPAHHNDAYLAALEDCWSAPVVRRCLPPDSRSTAIIHAHLRRPFYGRVADRVLLVDCQPKNILLPTPDEARFIDPEYTCGNPALMPAHFLMSLDRLGLRFPFRTEWERITAWKECFTAAYAQFAEPWVLDDLLFFYPWSLMRVLRQHAAQRPLLRPYLQWVYGRRLREYLHALDSASLAPPEETALATAA